MVLKLGVIVCDCFVVVVVVLLLLFFLAGWVVVLCGVVYGGVVALLDVYLCVCVGHHNL